MKQDPDHPGLHAIKEKCGEETPLISVIMPVFNGERHLREAVQSVQAQTESSWELQITDDASNDSTERILAELAREDSRIKVHRMPKNVGAAACRNYSLAQSNGRFIAYLDSDDVWLKDKLEKQTAFMLERNIGFCCSSYEVISDNGEPKDKIVVMLPSVNYGQFLMNNLLQTVGIIVDTSIVERDLLIMPDIRRRQDAATWFQVLKAGHECFGIPTVLNQYRRTNDSLSSNKVKAAIGTWQLYRDIEQLPLGLSLRYYVRYIVFAFMKRSPLGRTIDVSRS